MNFKSIILKNIKCFRDEAKLKLAPITLIYGANSVGKSKLWKFLMLLDENFRKNSKNNFLYSDDFGSKNTFVNSRNYPSFFEFGYEDIDLRVNISNEIKLGHSNTINLNKYKKQMDKLVTQMDNLSFLTKKIQEMQSNYKEASKDFERNYLLNMMEQFDFDINKTASALGLERPVLSRKLSSIKLSEASLIDRKRKYQELVKKQQLAQMEIMDLRNNMETMEKDTSIAIAQGKDNTFNQYYSGLTFLYKKKPVLNCKIKKIKTWGENSLNEFNRIDEYEYNNIIKKTLHEAYGKNIKFETRTSSNTNSTGVYFDNKYKDGFHIMDVFHPETFTELDLKKTKRLPIDRMVTQYFLKCDYLDTDSEYMKILFDLKNLALNCLKPEPSNPKKSIKHSDKIATDVLKDFGKWGSSAFVFSQHQNYYLENLEEAKDIIKEKDFSKFKNRYKKLLLASSSTFFSNFQRAQPLILPKSLIIFEGFLEGVNANILLIENEEEGYYVGPESDVGIFVDNSKVHEMKLYKQLYKDKYTSLSQFLNCDWIRSHQYQESPSRIVKINPDLVSMKKFLLRDTVPLKQFISKNLREIKLPFDFKSDENPDDKNIYASNPNIKTDVKNITIEDSGSALNNLVPLFQQLFIKADYTFILE